jgi:pimeloyl-ACP methyl ester carboxylesterase
MPTYSAKTFFNRGAGVQLRHRRLSHRELCAKAAKIVRGAEMKVYRGGSHGLAQVDPDTFNADVLAFLRS